MEKINNVLNILLIISLIVPGIRAMEQSGKHSSYRIQVGNDIIQAKGSTLNSIRAFKNLFEALTTEQDFIDLSTSLKSTEQQESFKKMIAVIEEEYKNQDFSDYSIDQIISILNCANDHDAPVAKKILLQECLNRFKSADNSKREQIISDLEGSLEKDGLNYNDRQQLYADLKLREALSAFTLRKVENVEVNPQNIMSYKTDYSKSADGTRAAKIRFEKKDKTTVADIYNIPHKKLVAILYNEFGNTGSTMGPQKGTSPVFSIAFNREGTLLALGGANGNVSLFEVEELEKDNKEQPKPKMVIPYNHAVTGLSFHPANSGLLYVAINNGSVYKWDINDNALKGAKSFFREGCITQLFIHKEKVYVANDVGLNILNLDLEDIVTLSVGKTDEVGISHDGNFIVAHYNDKKTFWRLNLNLKKEFTKDEILFLVALSQADKKLILCEHHNQKLDAIYKSNPDLLQISPRFIQDSCSMRCSIMKKLKSYWN